ncbi:hypothetical protein [Marinobacter sp.]|jgi:hypothetical protein|uniref:hypothetical protein n=1 Tax=Marinobacter sp. TaxID=50741 RepID=UPI0025828562|nr:hypothetical protein [Marinobacter sp.]
MDNIKIQEVLRAIEQDAIKGENEYESFQKILKSWKVKSIRDDGLVANSINAKEFIDSHKDIIAAIAKLEKQEHRITKYSSSAALLGIIGAAVAAPALPAAVIPAAIVSGLAAIGGFANKLKYEHDSIEKAKLLLRDVQLQEPDSGEKVS